MNSLSNGIVYNGKFSFLLFLKIFISNSVTFGMLMESLINRSFDLEDISPGLAFDCNDNILSFKQVHKVEGKSNLKSVGSLDNICKKFSLKTDKKYVIALHGTGLKMRYFYIFKHPDL